MEGSGGIRFLAGLRETTHNRGKLSRFAEGDLNPEPPHYEGEMLISLPLLGF